LDPSEHRAEDRIVGVFVVVVRPLGRENPVESSHKPPPGGHFRTIFFLGMADRLESEGFLSEWAK
jgi:hypothetical protein